MTDHPAPPAEGAPRPAGESALPARALADDLASLVWRLGRLTRLTSAVDGVPSSHVALLALLESDGALTGAELARGLGVTPQATAAAIAALLGDGLVERVASGGDERRRPVALTADGAAMLGRVRERRGAALERGVLEGLDARERAVLAEAVGILAAAVDPRRTGRA